MFQSKLTFKSVLSVLFNLLLIIPVFSSAAISDQAKLNFKNIYASELKPETYSKILNFCDKNDTDIDSCLRNSKAQASEQKSVQKQMSYSFCCQNVSGGWGDYVVIHGQGYCFPPCS